MGTASTVETPERFAKPQAAEATELSIAGMTCGNCARHVTDALQSVPGVLVATVSLEGGHALVQWNQDANPDAPALVQAVEHSGYEATVQEPHDHSSQTESAWQFTLWFALGCMVVLMAGEWLLGLGGNKTFQWFSFAVATVVQAWCGAPFYRGAWHQLKRKSANMDTLVALGSTTAYLYSAWSWLSGSARHVYFMESCAILTLISVGHWLEARVSSRASSALRSLLNLAPQRARRRNPAGGESEVPVAELRKGDLVALRPGERIPTDGAVVEGASSVDEAMLTGESTPVNKGLSDPVYGGSLNLNGALLMKVTETGENTALAHIIMAVRRAQSSRANIQRLGDRVSNVFVPVIIVIAIAAGLFWGLAPDLASQVHHWLSAFLWEAHPVADSITATAFIIAAAVLIVACPCAMGLATPAALMASANTAAQRGILIRDGLALEKAGAITAVLFDKTGTLTSGKPEAVVLLDRNISVKVRQAEPGGAPVEEKQSAVDLAAALARNSNHPVSQAVAKLSRKQFSFLNWRELSGSGVQADWIDPDNRTLKVRLGSLSWLTGQGVDVSEAMALVPPQTQNGAGIVCLAIDQSCRALFGMRDPLKPSSQEVVLQLQQQGMNIYLITGDNSQVAEQVARELKIPAENVFAGVRPEAKAEFVKKLQQRGERVAFVGDGINDAPALEQADLGIAVSRASDIAREAADIILLKSEIEAVPESLGLARATLRTIKQNLFWAFFYNAVGVPLAALGFMSPVLCAAAMGLSDLVVIGNALRLKRWRLSK